MIVLCYSLDSLVKESDSKSLYFNLVSMIFLLRGILWNSEDIMGSMMRSAIF